MVGVVDVSRRSHSLPFIYQSHMAPIHIVKQFGHAQAAVTWQLWTCGTQLAVLAPGALSDPMCQQYWEHCMWGWGRRATTLHLVQVYHLGSHCTLQNNQGNYDSPCALQCSWNCLFVGFLKKEAWGREWSPGRAFISVEDWAPWFTMECVCQNVVLSGNAVCSLWLMSQPNKC